MSRGRLERIAATCPDRELGRYLVESLRKIRAGLPAEQALGLCGTGAKLERDRLLRLAAALMEGTTTERARQIEQIDKRLARAKPRNDAEKLIAEAGKACRVPRWRQIFSILAAIPEGTATASADTEGEN